MYLADFHTHSTISPDARNTMTEMARAAVAAGLDELCFTDHMEPVNWGTQELRTSYQWHELSAEFQKAQSAVGERIKLRLGVELGDAPRDFAHVEKLMAEAPELDFVIGSEHMLSQRYHYDDLYFFDPADEAEARAGIADYLHQVQLLAAWGNFSVLGHLTLPLRYLNENHGFHLTFDGFEAEVETIFRTLIQNGCGIELNTNRGNEPLPGEKWLRMYRQLGGEIITLGSDAHNTQFVGCALRERQALLRACGFTRFCTFEKRQCVFHAL
ncbi:histidinol-phosphatase HisJ family protein [Oscillibacter sp.]|uniref:histidinol-phosphatase HisJ family protein n=1 Tax=Oscillibacter sp. TaxID=1945593 RepID=UPI0026263713|nr:histidinol-phosphatase HisJ family protein [Oscillibacter sp.]MDD3346365.1 histidinol-phosphatase HisJ family protein [Oscillibacter sp.]